MSVAEWVVLCRVGAEPGITPGEIAEALELTRGAVSKIIDKLEAKSWIARSTKQEDSRVQLLSLTRSGTRILPQLARIADENDREFFGALNPAESATLRRLLGKLAELHRIKAVPTD
ncbi:MAG: MarR family transcriptional regulator [Ignavibacteriota bacterium]